MVRRLLLSLVIGGVGIAVAAGGSSSRSAPAAFEKSKKSKTPTLTLSSSASSVIAGDPVTLTWSSTNVTTCVASGGWTGPRSVSGTTLVDEVRTAQTFVLSCTGKKGAVSREVVVEARDPPVPEVRITQNSEQVIRGQNVQLNWSSSNATACTASGDWSGSRSPNGQELVGPLDRNSIFLLTCTGRGGSATSRADVSVVPPPPFVLGTQASRVAEGAPTPTDRWGLNLVADLDGDARDDLVITGAFYPGEEGQWVPRPGYVAFNRATGFRAATSDEFPTASLQSVHAREFAVVDLNGDGVKDLFVADHGYDAGTFPGFRNQLFLSQGGQSRWIDATSRLPVVSDYTHSVTTGDVNGDGHRDIYVGNGGLRDAYILFGDGNGSFRADASVLPRLDIGYTASHLTDLDGDGRPELALGTGYSSRTTQVLWNQGGSFANSAPTKLPEPVDFGTEWSVMDLQSMDLDEDGRQDLVLAYQAHVWNGGWQLQFLVNDGNGGFVDRTSRYLAEPSVVSSGVPMAASPQTWIEFITPRDLNDDGRIDFWVTCKAWGGKIAADNCPVALIRQGDGSFKPITVGMLRSAGVPDYFFWSVAYAGTGVGTGGELVNVFRANDGRPGVNVMPITFTK